ncbi:MAG: glutamate--tRNA ligase, partial [Candidatus Levybacteria bacterium]|nr:glutamate--tRNA ligase [Candidatus Levybacteria bacterium]
MVRTRIAPSPTGYPHIGTIYQALFDYAYAKKNKGQFLVRIEDTDRERFVPDAEEKLFTALDWFGLTEDESPRKGGKYGPYRQSERLEVYQKYAQELLT